MKIPITEKQVHAIQHALEAILKPKESDLSVMILIHHDTDGFMSFGNACELCMFEAFEIYAEDADLQHITHEPGNEGLIH